MATAKSDPINLDKIERGLKQYYAEMGQKYDDQYSKHLDDNGFDEDDVESDLRSYEYTTLEVFENNFPFKKKITSDNENYYKDIVDILIYCNKFGAAPHTLKKIQLSRHKITNKVISESQKELQIQAPLIMGQIDKADNSNFILAARKVNNDFPVYEYLSDAYNRDRIEQAYNNEELQEPGAWSKNIEANGYDTWIEPLTKQEIQGMQQKIQDSVQSYNSRVCPGFGKIFTKAIDDDVIEIVNYIMEASQFIKQLIDSEDVTPPFQCELMIRFKKHQIVENGSTIEVKAEDCDTDPDEPSIPQKEVEKGKKKDVDYIGNVEEKLSAIKCVYLERLLSSKHSQDDAKNNDDDIGNLREMMKDYGLFKKKLDEKKRGKKKYKFKKLKKPSFYEEFNEATYPHRKRFCIFIERSMKNNGDRRIFFEPPEDCDSIPSGHSPLANFQLLQQCLIPGINYGDGVNNGSKTTISIKEGANSELLTFSFHIDNADSIKCYLGWGGKSMRFYPQDIIMVFKHMFTAKRYNKFQKNHEIWGKIMRNMYIHDTEFELFYKNLSGKEFPMKPKKLSQKISQKIKQVEEQEKLPE